MGLIVIRLCFFLKVIDDYVDPTNPVRFLDVFVDQLDLKTLGFTYATPTKTGRASSHPGDMLKLYLYGYVNKIRARRKLEARDPA